MTQQSSTPRLDITIATSAAEGGEVVLGVCGDIDLATADQFRTAVLGAFREYRPTLFVVDLARVPFLDLSGVSVLVELRTRAGDAGCRVRLLRPVPIVRRVLELIDFLPLFELETAGDQHA